MRVRVGVRGHSQVLAAAAACHAPSTSGFCIMSAMRFLKAATCFSRPSRRPRSSSSSDSSCLIRAAADESPDPRARTRVFKQLSFAFAAREVKSSGAFPRGCGSARRDG